jgi:hypothetical protein
VGYLGGVRTPTLSTALVLPLSLSLAFTLVACGKETGRVPMKAPGTAETTVNVTAGKKLALWTSLDMKYSGGFDAHYEVELVEGGATTAKTTCDPFDVNVKTSSKEININGNHSISYNGKMRCELVPTKTGAATVRATLAFGGKAAGVDVKDMSLVIKE